MRSPRSPLCGVQVAEACTAAEAMDALYVPLYVFPPLVVSMSLAEGHGDAQILAPRIEAIMYQFEAREPLASAAIADYTINLPSVASSVPMARSITRQELASRGLDALSDVAELLVTELVTNALRHADGSHIGLALTYRHGVFRCEVEDSDQALPLVCGAQGEEESGRGLLLVERLAARWGSRLSRLGKIVWFELALPHAVVFRQRFSV